MGFIELVKKTSSACFNSSMLIGFSIIALPLIFIFSIIHRRITPAIQPSVIGGVKVFLFLIIKILATLVSQILSGLFNKIQSSRLFFFAYMAAKAYGRKLFVLILARVSQLFFAPV